MKKVITIIVVVVAAIALLSKCGSSDTASQKTITSGGTTAAAPSTSSLASSGAASSTASASPAGRAETAGSGSAERVTIEEQLLYDEAGFKITATEYVTDAIWGDGIRILIENNTAEDIGLGCTALIVNDYMIMDLFSATVAAGKKDYETLYFSSTELNAAGIENVGKVEIYFHTFQPDTYMTIQNLERVTILTSAYARMDTTPSDAGQELYQEGGVRIVGKYVDENSFWGAAVLLYIENNSGRNVIVQCDNMSINGFMVTPFFSASVYDGKKSIDEITLMSTELEENGITSIDEVELNFKILDERYSTIAESGTVSFSAR